MNRMTQAMPATEQSDQTLESALANHGWRADSVGTQWSLATPRGKAGLTDMGDRCGCHRWRLRGGAVGAPARGTALQANHRLNGPCKFVEQAQGRPICRVDVPDEVAHGGPLGFNSTAGRGFSTTVPMFQSWAAALTQCAAGRTSDDAPAEIAPDELARELTRSGWSAQVEEDAVEVHIQLPGVFRKIHVQQQRASGAVVWTELAELEGLEPSSLEASLHLASEANTRLSLVRITHIPDARTAGLRAEVHFGRVLIPAWLPTALEAVEATVALVARELQALRDPELAKLVLAAAAA